MIEQSIGEIDPQILNSEIQKQTVTSDLKMWIAAVMRDGMPAAELLQTLHSKGWADVANDAVNTVIHETFPGMLNQGMHDKGSPVPEPVMRDMPGHLDAGDRIVDVLFVADHPRVILLGNFMSDEECDALVTLAKPRTARSMVIEERTGNPVMDTNRTSDGMFFGLQENPLVARLEQRIAHLFNWPIENGEGLQVLNYKQGAEYKPHQDYFDPNDSGSAGRLSEGGQRVATLVMYLSTPVHGGGTGFPAARMMVPARKGQALFFSYWQPTTTQSVLHGGLPVITGEKWAATKWFRQRPHLAPRPVAGN